MHLLCEHSTGGQPEETRAAVSDASVKVAESTNAMLMRNEEIAEFLGFESPICFIGRGYSFTSAQISALIALEAATLRCASFSAGQFRHGPVERLREGFVSVFYFWATAVGDIKTALLENMLWRGGRALDPSNGDQVPGLPESDQPKVVSFPPVASATAQILEVIPTQTLQFPFSPARGFVPVDFLNNSKITAVEQIPDGAGS